MSQRCFYCNCEESESNPLMPEGFYEGLMLCHNCWFSEEIRDWRINKEKTDAEYKRYSDLITAGFKVECKACGEITTRSPKFIGQSPTWELCCSHCSEINYDEGKPYKFDLAKWHSLYDQFLKGKFDIDENWEELLELEKTANVPNIKCKCGGNFTMLAKPRCKKCNNVICNSIFHICDGYYA